MIGQVEVGAAWGSKGCWPGRGLERGEMLDSPRPFHTAKRVHTPEWASREAKNRRLRRTVPYPLGYKAIGGLGWIRTNILTIMSGISYH